MKNPYHTFVSEYARILRSGSGFPCGGQKPTRRSALPRDAGLVMLFSPHPDDECITGALPLRLQRELRLRIMNVTVTLGSRKDRRRERAQEVKNACDHLGWELLHLSESGLEAINESTRQSAAAAWRADVKLVAAALREEKPAFVFYPHEDDANTTHRGTCLLVRDALAALPNSFSCWVVETEFWAPLRDPNLMVESSVADVADLVTALSFHEGEVRRNPYHLRLPAWMQDNVRRGGELVAGQGGQAPTYIFATLYRVRKWNRGGFEAANFSGRLVGCEDSLAPLFG